MCVHTCGTCCEVRQTCSDSLNSTGVLRPTSQAFSAIRRFRDSGWQLSSWFVLLCLLLRAYNTAFCKVEQAKGQLTRPNTHYCVRICHTHETIIFTRVLSKHTTVTGLSEHTTVTGQLMTDGCKCLPILSGRKDYVCNGTIDNLTQASHLLGLFCCHTQSTIVNVCTWT